MGIIELLESNKAILGGLSIAIATLIAVLINLWHTKRHEQQQLRQNQASFASALAAELIDNSQNLIDLYLEMESVEFRKHKITLFKHFDQIVYQTLLHNLGELGSSLSFLIVDIYGDIKKIKARLEVLSPEEIVSDRVNILPDIQQILVKTTTGSIVMLFYASYLSGSKFMKAVRERHMIWVEKTIDQYCQYVAKIDKSLDFTSLDEDDSDKEFFKRFANAEDKSRMKALFQEIETVFDQLHGRRRWEAALKLRALSYKISNTLNHFLEIEPSEYELTAEQQYL